MYCIIQGTNMPMVVRYPEDISDSIDVNVGIYNSKGTTLIAFDNSDVNIAGNIAVCKMTQAQTMNIDSGTCYVETKRTDSDGITRFYDMVKCKVINRNDKRELAESASTNEDTQMIAVGDSEYPETVVIDVQEIGTVEVGTIADRIANLESDINKRSIVLSDYATAGSTDQTAKIQEALNAAKGKMLIIPEGTFCFASTLTVKSGTRIVGCGEKSKLKLIVGGTLDSFDWRNYQTTDPDYDADKLSQKVAIKFETDAKGIVIDNVDLSGCTTAQIGQKNTLLLVRGSNHVLTNVSVHDVDYFNGKSYHGGYGIFVFGANTVSIINCCGYRCGYEAIGTECSSNITINGGHYHDCIRVPMQIHRESTNISINGVVSERGSDSTYDSTLTLHGTETHQLSKVKISNSHFGKHIQGVQGGEHDVSIVDCTIGNSIYNEAPFTDTGWVISGCKVVGAIRVHGQYHMITGNTILGSDYCVVVDDFTSIVRDNIGKNNNKIKVGNLVYAAHKSVNEYAHIFNQIPMQMRDVTAGDSMVISVPYPNATYQWQYSTNGTSWNGSTSADATTDTFTVTAKPEWDGRMYRCKITDPSGHTVYSAVTKMNVKDAVEVPEIATMEDIMGYLDS